jgi:hypothetical protein
MIKITIQKLKSGRWSSRTGTGKRGEYDDIAAAINAEAGFVVEQQKTPSPEPIVIEVWPYQKGKA